VANPFAAKTFGIAKGTLICQMALVATAETFLLIAAVCFPRLLAFCLKLVDGFWGSIMALQRTDLIFGLLICEGRI